MMTSCLIYIAAADCLCAPQHMKALAYHRRGDACGAPVIASNASSLPEVIGNAEALFDPLSADDICAKIVQVLEDPAFSSSLGSANFLGVVLGGPLG